MMKRALVAWMVLAAFAIASRGQDAARNLYVVAHVDVPPNFMQAAAVLLQQFAAESRKDAGAVRVEVLQETARPNHFTLLEVWRTRPAFEAHVAATHTKSFREKLHAMLGVRSMNA